MNSQNKRPILHIGYPKTGTSWFQKKVFPNARGIEFYTRKRILNDLGAEWKEIDDASALNELLKKKQKRIVISDESMIGGIKWIEHNLKIYKEVFFPAQIIIFIRNQMDIHISAYSQYIKLGGTAKFEDFLFPASDEIRAGKKHCYDSIINLYKKNFGESNVYVYLFEDLVSNPSGFMKQFCENHQLEIDVEPLLRKKSNLGLSRNLLRMKRISNFLTKKNYSRIPGEQKKADKIRFYIPYWYELSLISFEILNRLFRNREKANMAELIGEKQTQMLKDFYKKSNRLLISQHGLGNIENYHYPL